MTCNTMTHSSHLRLQYSRITLPGVTPNLIPLQLFDNSADVAAWRLIETFGSRSLPYELKLSWSASTGTGASARITVPGAARVCVFARSLTLLVTSLSDSMQEVRVTGGDGFAPTTNSFELRGHCAPEAPLELPVPPFARDVLVQLAEPEAVPGSVLTLYDGQEIARARLVGTHQPTLSSPLGGAARMVLTTRKACEMRAIYSLSL